MRVNDKKPYKYRAIIPKALLKLALIIFLLREYLFRYDEFKFSCNARKNPARN